MCCRRSSRPEPASPTIKLSSEAQHLASPREPEYTEGLSQELRYRDPRYVPATSYTSVITTSQPDAISASIPFQLAQTQQLDAAAARLSSFLSLKFQGSWLGHDAGLVEKSLLQRTNDLEKHFLEQRGQLHLHTPASARQLGLLEAPMDGLWPAQQPSAAARNWSGGNRNYGWSNRM